MANEISIKSRNELILENILGANNVLPTPVSLTETLLTCWLNGDTYTDEIYDPSRNTSALLAIINGTTYDATPICEIEALLAAIANGTDPDEKYLPPKSRIGALLYEIFQNREVQILNDVKNWANMLPRPVITEYQIGYTGNYYNPNVAYLTTVPDELTAHSLPAFKIGKYKKIKVETESSLKFGIIGYNEEVTTSTSIALLSDNLHSGEFDISGSAYLNVLLTGMSPRTMYPSEFSKIKITVS